MINYWSLSRPKRKLHSIPEVLATMVETTLHAEWESRQTHISLEDALENAGLKGKGDRRDQTGGGGRTYVAWLISLGLIFKQKSTGLIRLTLAGEALMQDKPPIEILKNQVLKYQFPSVYSVNRSVGVSSRFKIRPFIFILKLLSDPEIASLSVEEIAKVVIVEADRETKECYKRTVRRILQFRKKGDKSLDADFFDKYKSSKIKKTGGNPFSHLIDIANTAVNWIEYTQLAIRDPKDGNRLKIVPSKESEVSLIIEEKKPLIKLTDNHEKFQRTFGLDPYHQKDTRKFGLSKNIGASSFAEKQVIAGFIKEVNRTPITRVTAKLVERIVKSTGFQEKFVENVLRKIVPGDRIDSFFDSYIQLANAGRSKCTEFELATVELFRELFGYRSEHTGNISKAPDVVLVSDDDYYSAIIDNKSIKAYTLPNDHQLRMISEYISNFSRYFSCSFTLAFFMYIAGGFNKNIDKKIQKIAEESTIPGSAISAYNLYELFLRHKKKPLTHAELKNVFSLNREIMLSDIKAL